MFGFGHQLVPIIENYEINPGNLSFRLELLVLHGFQE